MRFCNRRWPSGAAAHGVGAAGMDQAKRNGIAHRIACLLAETPLARAAARLRVQEADLGAILGARPSAPMLEVLAAVVREYGVDPSWVVTGVYDGHTHRRALLDDTAVIDLLAQAFAGDLEMIPSRFSFDPSVSGHGRGDDDGMDAQPSASEPRC